MLPPAPITPHPLTGLYDIGDTRTARSLGFMGPVLVMPPLWYLCIWRDGKDPSWPERVNELLTSLRSTYYKANQDAYVLTFTPPFKAHWQPLAARMAFSEGKLKFFVTLLSQAKRTWPELRKVSRKAA